MQSDFNRVARSLIKHKIHFTTSDAEPRFEIQGGRFTTNELTRLTKENRLTNLDLSEITRTKRKTAAVQPLMLVSEYIHGSIRSARTQKL
jgi:hypothetical protein